MIHLEPAYLRYIYDGLIKGSIHPENAAELPDGLIGMYEVAFDERISVLERQKLLQRFTIWALLKKEVSAAFVAEVLGEAEDDIQEFISAYSAWFNSPESGKYQLYHERLRIYLLQKLSDREILGVNEFLVSRLEDAIDERRSSMFDSYALEFLSFHHFVSALVSGNSMKLKDLLFNDDYRDRQLIISKEYNWSKNSVKQLLVWALKFNKDLTLECALQLVNLHRQEQNSAAKVINFIAEGDINTSLNRMEYFGGGSKEELSRKLVLYIFCLIELLYISNIEYSYRREAVKNLLKHLDEQIPIISSDLNIGDFFGEEIFINIIDAISKMNLDYSSLSNRYRLVEKFCYLYDKPKDDITLTYLFSDDYVVIDNNISLQENSEAYFEEGLSLLASNNTKQASINLKAAVYCANLIPEDDTWGSFGDHLKSLYVNQLLELGYNHIAVQIYMTMQKDVGWDEDALKDICNALLQRKDRDSLEYLFQYIKSKIVFKAYSDYLFSVRDFIQYRSIFNSFMELEPFMLNAHRQLIFFERILFDYPSMNTVYRLLTEFHSYDKNRAQFGDVLLEKFCLSNKFDNSNYNLLTLINLVRDDFSKASLVKYHAEYIYTLDGGIEFIIENGRFREDQWGETFYEEIFTSICNEANRDSLILLFSTHENEREQLDIGRGIVKAVITKFEYSDEEISIFYRRFKDQFINLNLFDDLTCFICNLLIEIGKYGRVLELIDMMDDSIDKSILMYKYARILKSNDDYIEADNILQVCTSLLNSFIDTNTTEVALKRVTEKFAYIGAFDCALRCALNICDKTDKNELLVRIYSRLDRFEDALSSLRNLDLDQRKLIVLQEFVDYAYTNGHLDLASVVIEELRSEALDIEDYILGSSIISSLCRLYLLFGQNDRAMSFCGQLEGLAQIECLIDIQKDLTRKFNTMINTESFFELQLSSVENFKHEDRIYAYKLMLHDLFNMDSSIISNDHDIVIYRVRRILHEVLVIFGKVEIFNYSSFQNFFHLLSKLPSEITLVSSMNDLVAIIELIPFRPERCEAWESLFGINFSESHVIMAMKAGNEIHDESIKLEFYDALIDSIPIHFWSSDWIYQFSYILKDDLLSLEKALHGFALKRMFLDDCPEEEIKNYLLHLNVKWVLDIKYR